MPVDLVDIGSIMSNFDHEIEVSAEEALKGHKTFGIYPAWNFLGKIWYAGSKFKCAIWQYHSHVNTIEGNNLKEIMEKASDLYGDA